MMRNLVLLLHDSVPARSGERSATYKAIHDCPSLAACLLASLPPASCLLTSCPLPPASLSPTKPTSVFLRLLICDCVSRSGLCKQLEPPQRSSHLSSLALLSSPPAWPRCHPRYPSGLPSQRQPLPNHHNPPAMAVGVLPAQMTTRSSKGVHDSFSDPVSLSWERSPTPLDSMQSPTTSILGLEYVTNANCY